MKEIKFIWRDVLVLPLLITMLPVVAVVFILSAILYWLGGDWTKDKVFSIKF